MLLGYVHVIIFALSQITIISQYQSADFAGNFQPDID